MRYASRRPPTKQSLIFGFVACGAMVAIGIAVFFFGVIPRYMHAQSLLTEGKPVAAQITGVYDPSRGGHRYARYTYQVNGQAYNGKDNYSGGYGDRGPIQVYYLPSKPDFSAIDREGISNNTKIQIPAMLVWEAIVVAAFLGIRSQWKRAV